MSTFSIFGYFREYYVNGKFIGSMNCEKDRDTFGYYGAINETLQTNIRLDNGKKIKAGQTVKTLLFPLCGNIISE